MEGRLPEVLARPRVRRSYIVIRQCWFSMLLRRPTNNSRSSLFMLPFPDCDCNAPSPIGFLPLTGLDCCGVLVSCSKFARKGLRDTGRSEAGCAGEGMAGEEALGFRKGFLEAAGNVKPTGLGLRSVGQTGQQIWCTFLRQHGSRMMQESEGGTYQALVGVPQAT